MQRGLTFSLFSPFSLIGENLLKFCCFHCYASVHCHWCCLWSSFAFLVYYCNMELALAEVRNACVDSLRADLSLSTKTLLSVCGEKGVGAVALLQREVDRSWNTWTPKMGELVCGKESGNGHLTLEGEGVATDQIATLHNIVDYAPRRDREVSYSWPPLGFFLATLHDCKTSSCGSN